MRRAITIFGLLLALAVGLPTLQPIMDQYTREGGIFDQTFNASDAATWNATGEILTVNQTARIALSPFESAIWRIFLPLTAVFIVLLIILVLGKWGSGRGEESIG